MVSQTKRAIQLVVLFAEIQNQSLNGLSKVKRDLHVPCPWLCGVVVGSVGASGCLEGLGAAAGLLLDRGFPLRCHNTVAFIRVPSHAHRQIHTLGKFRLCGKKYKCTSLNMLSPLKASFFLFLFKIALFFQLLCLAMFCFLTTSLITLFLKPKAFALGAFHD